jgi:hypothetical protein
MRGELLNYAIVAVLLTGCSRTPTPNTTDKPGTPADNFRSLSQGQVQLDSIRWTAPAQWKKTEPSSSFIAVEFVLPRADGDEEDGRLTISTAGGTVQANIDRWKGQFNPQPQQPSQELIEAGGMTITLVDLSGDFNDQRGPFAPPVKRANYRMIGAVIPQESQLNFIKATGPQKTIANHAEAIHEFIRSGRQAR